MKKIVVLLLSLILVFILAACGGNIDTSSTQSEEFDILEPFVLHTLSYEFQCEELKTIVDYNHYYDLFITDDGTLYKIGNFSDGTKLKKIGEGINFVKFSRGTIISDNNDVYQYKEKDFSVSLFNNGEGDTLTTVIESGDYINSAHAMDVNNEFIITSTIKDDKVYLFGDGSGHEGREIPTEPIYCFDKDEKIELYIDGTIKTNKGYYYFKETVTPSQYDDIPTTYTYSIEKITVLNSDIVFVKHYEYLTGTLICTVDKTGCLRVYNLV